MNKTKLALAAVGSQVGMLLTAGSAFATGIAINQADLPTGFFNDPNQLITNLVNIAFVIAVILVFFYLIWGGIEWITSGGEKGKTESARNKITAAVIGLIILAAAFAILTLTLQLLGYADLSTALSGANSKINTNQVQ